MNSDKETTAEMNAEKDLNQTPEGEKILNPTPETKVDQKKKKKKKKTKTSSETPKASESTKKRKPPAGLARLKKKMEEEAALKKKLEEEEEAERERLFQEQEAARLKTEEANREKKKAARNRAKENKKEREKEAKRLEALQRLGMDPSSNPRTGKKVVYGKRKRRAPPTQEKPPAPIEKEPSTPIKEPEEDNWEDMLDDESEVQPQESKETSKEESQMEEKDLSEMLRAPICCVLGGVDAGKTTFIDNIKHTNVQLGEAGGITQKISAIWINNKSPKFNTPGILILDTPGHDSFHNLRHLGASICNLVILMIDITEDIKSQTIKAIDLIKEKMIPFIVILNKIDRLFDWKSGKQGQKMKEIIESQSQGTQNHFYQRVADIQTKIMEQGLNAELHYQNDNPKKYISMIPISSRTGEGVMEVLSFILKLTTKYLHKGLVFEKKRVGGIILGTEIVKGFGNCINLILSNGQIQSGDTLVLESVSGAIESPVLKIITPLGKKQYQVHKEASGTINVKAVLRKDLDLNCLIIGSHIHVIPEAVPRIEFLEKITGKIESEMSALERNKSSYGISLHSRTYGALEALIDYLEEKKIPYFRSKIGKVKKLDLITCGNTNELVRDNHYNILVAFDTEFDFDLKQVPTNTKVITGNIIYRLFEAIEDHIKESKEALLERQKQRTVYPAKIEVIDEQHVFAKRNPILVGVKVLEGKLRVGTPLMVMKDGSPMRIGTVTSLKDEDDKSILEVTPGMKVPVKIEPDLGHVVRQIGRDFDVDATIYSHLDDNSSYNLRKYFWETMTDPEHKLVVELEKLLRLR